MPRNGFTLRPRQRPGRAVLVGAVASLVLALAIMQVLWSWQEMSGAGPTPAPEWAVALWDRAQARWPDVPARWTEARVRWRDAQAVVTDWCRDEFYPWVVRAQTATAPALNTVEEQFDDAWNWVRDEGAPRTWSWLRREIPLRSQQIGGLFTTWAQRWRSGWQPAPCGPAGCQGDVSPPALPPA